jgi:hypothetical protein
MVVVTKNPYASVAVLLAAEGLLAAPSNLDRIVAGFSPAGRKASLIATAERNLRRPAVLMS